MVNDILRTRVLVHAYPRLSGEDSVQYYEYHDELSSMVTDLVYHDEFTKHEMAVGHPENPQRLRSALKGIETTGLIDEGKITLHTPGEPSLSHIHRLHDIQYIEGIKRKSEKGGGVYTLDTSVNSHSYKAALLAAGGGLEAVDRVLSGTSRNAFVLCRPPGHHAEYTRAFGFCFINNVAVAAAHLIEDCGLQRVMIVDYDAHHGNGTQNAFYGTNKVLYVGLHQDGRTLFPGSGFPNEIGEGEGEGYTVNLSMYPGAGDASYRQVFTEVVEPLAESFKPEFVLVSVGYDGHFKDPLTSLGLTTAGFAFMNSRLVSMGEQYASGSIVCFLEGGYNLDVMSMGATNLVQRLSGSDVSEFEDMYKESDKSRGHTDSLVEYLAKTIPLLQ